MNRASQYIFGLYQFVLNVRDTLEYTINRDHPTRAYEERKRIIVANVEQENSPFGNFVLNNKEQSQKIVETLKTFVEDFYSDGNSVLTVAGDNVRVDYTQNIKIFEETIQVVESLRDVLYAYINYTRQQNELEDVMNDLIKKDERLYRSIVNMLVIQEFEKSFSEFQKVMSESKGKPTPQSNFIVQNELVKLSGLIRFSRQHAHCTDNETLDLLDKTICLLEMTEGRRDRRDNKSFKELFDDVKKGAVEAVRKYEPEWKASFDKVVGLVIEEQAKNNEPISKNNA